MIFKFIFLPFVLFLFCLALYPTITFSDEGNQESTDNQVPSKENIQACTQTAKEIQKKLSTSKNIEGCYSSFDIYKKNLKKCLHTSDEEYEYSSDNIPELAYAIAECFREKRKWQEAKEVYQFSLQYPNWERLGPTTCPGELAWKEALEYLNFQQQKIQRCLPSKDKLADLLEQFKKTKDTNLLKTIRGSGFFMNHGLEGGCSLPFAMFEEEFKDALKHNNNLTITPIINTYERHPDENFHFVAIKGFADNKIWVLYFIKTKPELCYFFTGYTQFDNEEELKGIYKEL